MQRLALFFSFILSFNAFSLEFDRYHKQDEINRYLRDLAREYPTMVKFYTLGESDQKREISYITLTKGTEALPAIYFNGTHHGNEWSSTESILGLIDYLIVHRDDEAISNLLSKYVFYLQPLVNPDGHLKHTREDINGKDPNRDYNYPGGSNKFKTKIISLMRKLVDSRKFIGAVAYHSGIEEVLWPWCYTGAATNHKDVFYTISKKAAVAMKYSRYLQSYNDYATNGEFIDYLYMSQGTIALTFEVSSALTPSESQLDFVVKRSIKGALAYIEGLAAYHEGRLRVESAPLWTTRKSPNPLWELLGEKLE